MRQLTTPGRSEKLASLPMTSTVPSIMKQAQPWYLQTPARAATHTCNRQRFHARARLTPAQPAAQSLPPLQRRSKNRQIEFEQAGCKQGSTWHISGNGSRVCVCVFVFVGGQGGGSCAPHSGQPPSLVCSARVP